MKSFIRIARYSMLLSIVVVLFYFSYICGASADVIINVLAVNGTKQDTSKDISFSLPGEIKPEDVVDAAGLTLDYNVEDAGYFLHGKVSLNADETKTFRVRIKDKWRVSIEDVNAIRDIVEQGYKEMGAERSVENGEAQKSLLLSKLEYILEEQENASGDINTRIDTYRNHIQTLEEIRYNAKLIDYWRSDAHKKESEKKFLFVVDLKNPQDKPRTVKEKYYLPPEVRPEYVSERQGFEIRYDEEKKQPFLFKEMELAAKEEKTIKVGIKDVWYVPQEDSLFMRERADTMLESLAASSFFETAKELVGDIENNLDMIDLLQAQEQENINQHIGVYRINKRRFDKAQASLDALEKLLARYRADLEKSKVKNIMEKIRALKSLSKISEAIFDKKPRVNTAWQLIGGVMVFLAILTIIHFILWFIRSGKQAAQEEIGQAEEKKLDNEDE